MSQGYADLERCGELSASEYLAQKAQLSYGAEPMLLED
jgi:hypothetical protein|tara:strand:+ start:2778 stop:2891 length:114 start_codon:yes stop_codon:yes gene_type:complete